MAASILIIDDEREILTLLTTVLKREGFDQVYTADSAKAGLLSYKQYRQDLVLLDVMLPDGNGFDLYKDIQQVQAVPILFISALDEEVDRLLGFALGAEDYITKPFSPKEVAYRVKARLRRHLPEGISKADHIVKEVGPAPIQFGSITVDPVAGEIRRQGVAVECTAKEIKLLYFLASNPNRILTKEQIALAVWGEHFQGFDNTISVHIRKLRLKVEDDPANPTRILTVIGLGYKFVNKA